MILAIHIIISTVAVITTFILGFKSFTRQLPMKIARKLAVNISSGLSVVSGVVLILQGSSIARVCIEASVLIVSAIALNIYSKKLDTKKVINLN